MNGMKFVQKRQNKMIKRSKQRRQISEKCEKEKEMQKTQEALQLTQPDEFSLKESICKKEEKNERAAS